MNLLDIIAPVIMLGTTYLLLFTAFMDEVGARDDLTLSSRHRRCCSGYASPM